MSVSLGEEQVIARYFDKYEPDPHVVSGIGDDGAVINLSGARLVLSTDTLVEGTHFKINSDASRLGHKALAVNLSDLAAMGARPRWALLALTIPNAGSGWLEDFSDGFFRLANRHGVSLIGGDTTRGPLTITVQLIGTLDEAQGLYRNTAQVGDGIYVTGRIAETALAMLHEDTLKAYPQSHIQCLKRMKQPTPRVPEGLLLARYATAAIDISDGILKDLSRILSASGVGAKVDIDDIPMIPEIAQCCSTLESLLEILSYGEDYELLFTLSDACLDELKPAFGELGTPITRIGTIEKQQGLRCYRHLKPVELPQCLGYDHFV